MTVNRNFHFKYLISGRDIQLILLPWRMVWVAKRVDILKSVMYFSCFSHTYDMKGQAEILIMFLPCIAFFNLDCKYTLCICINVLSIETIHVSIIDLRDFKGKMDLYYTVSRQTIQWTGITLSAVQPFIT
mgnify:CR=1 FL=1